MMIGNIIGIEENTVLINLNIDLNKIQPTIIAKMIAIIHMLAVLRVVNISPNLSPMDK